MFYLSLFGRFLKVRIQSQLEYPLAYVMGIIAQWVGYGAQFAAMWLMVQTFGTMADWKPMEVLFLYAMNTLSYSIGASFMLTTSNTLPDTVRDGSLDDMLLKPVNSLLYSMFSGVNVSYVSHMSLSIVMMAVSLTALGIIMTPLKLVWLFITVCGSALIHMSAMILTVAPAMIFVGNQGWRFLYWDMEEFVHYPISIYGKPLQILLTFVLPYAFIGFYPAQPFLMKSDTLMFPQFFQYITPLVGVLMLAIATIVWKICINRYESTGS